MPEPNLPVCCSLNLQESIDQFPELISQGRQIRLVGRVRSVRKHGAVVFITLQDLTGQMQVLFDRLDAPELGDLVSVAGTAGKSRRGTYVLFARQSQVLAACHRLQNAPEEIDRHAGRSSAAPRVTEIAFCARLAEILTLRATLIRELRRYFWEAGFVEVDTPLLERCRGSAAARPFATRATCNGEEYYLRKTSETWLKRAIIAGFPKVFEIGKNFRNEGVSSTHCPEFQQCEVYVRGAGYREMLALLRELLRLVSRVAAESQYVDRDFVEACQQGPEVIDFATFLCKHNEIRHGTTAGDQSGELAAWKTFQKCQLPKIAGLQVVLHGPYETNPLTMRRPGALSLVEDFRVYWHGVDFGHGATELSDPEEQRERLRTQMDSRRPDGVGVLDEAFLEAVEFGLPSCGGLAFTIDRIMKVMCKTPTIHDCLWFPQF